MPVETKIVPCEPTEAMLSAGSAEASLCGEWIGDGRLIAAYKAMLAASPPAETGEGLLLRFGLGELVVNTGKFGGECAVFIAKAKDPGIVGQETGRAAFDRDCLQPGEHVFLFPSVERANAVADALVNAHPASDQSDTERMRAAVSVLESALKPLARAINQSGTRPNVRLSGTDAAMIIVASNKLRAALAEKAADK